VGKLTAEQAKDIHIGKIRNGKKVGGAENAADTQQLRASADEVRAVGLNKRAVGRMDQVVQQNAAVVGRAVAAVTMHTKVAAFAFLVAAAGVVQAAQIAGIRIATSARVGGSDLALQGAGLRQLFRTDVYIIGLYLMKPKDSAEDVLGDAGPKRIALRLMRDVTAQSLVDALYEGIRDNTTAAEFARLKPAADELAAMMLLLKVAKKGDIVALDYVPDSGSQIVVNGHAAGHPVPGRDLYRALLKIWLGDAPVDQELKRALLSRGANTFPTLMHR
jgi:hypothetical protein